MSGDIGPNRSTYVHILIKKNLPRTLMNLQDKRAATFPMINCPPGKGGLGGSLGGTVAIGDILSDTNMSFAIQSMDTLRDRPTI